MLGETAIEDCIKRNSFSCSKKFDRNQELESAVASMLNDPQYAGILENLDSFDTLSNTPLSKISEIVASRVTTCKRGTLMKRMDVEGGHAADNRSPRMSVRKFTIAVGGFIFFLVHFLSIVGIFGGIFGGLFIGNLVAYERGLSHSNAVNDKVASLCNFRHYCENWTPQCDNYYYRRSSGCNPPAQINQYTGEPLTTGFADALALGKCKVVNEASDKTNGVYTKEQCEVEEEKVNSVDVNEYVKPVSKISGIIIAASIFTVCVTGFTMKYVEDLN